MRSELGELEIEAGGAGLRARDAFRARGARSRRLREAQRGSERLRSKRLSEAQRSSDRLREAQKGSEMLGEAQRSSDRLREA